MEGSIPLVERLRTRTSFFLLRITYALVYFFGLYFNGLFFKGIILESPFTSISELAQKMYPIYPVKYLIWDKFDNISKINNLLSPLLLLHGKNDEVVPYNMGKKLYEEYNNKKDYVFVDEAMHNNLYDYGVANKVIEFINKL